MPDAGALGVYVTGRPGPCRRPAVQALGRALATALVPPWGPGRQSRSGVMCSWRLLGCGQWAKAVGCGLADQAVGCGLGVQVVQVAGQAVSRLGSCRIVDLPRGTGGGMGLTGLLKGGCLNRGVKIPPLIFQGEVVNIWGQDNNICKQNDRFGNIWRQTLKYLESVDNWRFR